MRGADGEFLVLEDNLMTPSGFAYAVAARDAVLPELTRSPTPRRAASPSCRSCWPARCGPPSPVEREPYLVVLTDGPDNAAHWEHEWAAEALGVPLVEPDDLRLDGDRLRARRARASTSVYRRTNDDLLDTDVGRLLGPPMRAGTLGVVNAFGCGVGDDKLAHAYVEDMVRFYLGEEPRLRSVPTLDLGAPRRTSSGRSTRSASW